MCGQVFKLQQMHTEYIKCRREIIELEKDILYFDAETGFYYLRARYYSPEMSRFVSEDPAHDGWNWYTYALNDPVNFADPSGEIAVAVAAAIVAAAIGGAAITYAELVRIGSRLSIPSNILRRVYSMLAPLAAKRGNDNKGKAQGSSAKASPEGQAAAASPMPPNSNGQNNRRGGHDADSTYNKNGVRVDYEYYGNGKGNVHIHTKEGKFYYDAASNSFRTGYNSASSAAPRSIQALLKDREILKAIHKGLYYISG